MNISAIHASQTRIPHRPGGARDDADPPRRAAAPAAAGARPPITASDPQFDPASVGRGQELFVAQCGFCHGSNARGGSSGPDLTRSVLVQDDEGGRQLGEFLRGGRPDAGMPAFDLAAGQVTDVATFLHAAIFLNANRRLYQVLDILTGDPKAGEAFFNGAGRCGTCHSAAGDLKGIGAKHEPVALQQRLLMPRGRSRRRTAAAGLSRQERDQGHGHAAVASGRVGRARPPHRLRHHAVRSGVRTDPFVAARRATCPESTSSIRFRPTSTCGAGGPTTTCTT